MIKPWIFAGVVGALAAVLLVTGMATAVGISLQVQVRDAAGRPAANATVCAGTSNDRASRGFARTNANGLAIVALATPSGSPMAIVVTANLGTRGASVTTTGIATPMLTLPAAGGPACPESAPNISPGTFVVDPTAIRDHVREVTPNAPPLVGPINMAPERCFGAAGTGCNDSIGGVGTCFGGSCTINAGSWQHDECCLRNRSGGMCDGRFEEIVTAQGIGGPPQVCQAEFNMAFSRVGTPLSWRRQINVNTVNNSGTVDFAGYCAPAGSFMPRGEASRFCCSRQARALNPAESAAASVAHLQTLAGGDTIQVCR